MLGDDQNKINNRWELVLEVRVASLDLTETRH